MRQLLLISSSRTHDFPAYFQSCESEVKRFLSSSNVKNVLFIPYALKDYDEYLKDIKVTFNKFGFNVNGIHKSDSPKQAVNDAEAIFIGGGNTFRLLKTLYDNDLIAAIQKRVLEDGCPYIGVSAGTNVATRSIHTTNDMPIVYPPTFESLKLVPFNINPHYVDTDPTTKHKGETRDVRISEYMQNCQDVKWVLGLREGAFLSVTDEKMVLGGFNGAKLLHRDGTSEEFTCGTDISHLLAHP